MNLANLRSKQKHIQRTLQSIPLPKNTHKIVTEAEETTELDKRNNLFNESKEVKPSKRYHQRRYFQSEQQQSLAKYKSLEMRSGTRKVSYHKFERESSQFEPYNRPVRKKTSAHNIQPIPALQDRYFLKSKRNKKRDPTEIKSLAREVMGKGQFSAALALLSHQEQFSRSDMQVLEMKGVCLLRLQKYQRAIEVLSKVVLYDRKNCRQALIWCALCENQLNRPERSMSFVDQCLRLFPTHYEAYYFKGKILMKLKQIQQALQYFQKASNLNQEKQQIRLFIGECKQMKGEFEAALEIYEELLPQVTYKDLKFCSKMARLMIKLDKLTKGQYWFERCIQFFEKSTSSDIEDILLETAYMISRKSFMKGELEKTLMKGEWILTRGKSKWTEPVIRVMMTVKIVERDFYGALNIAERLQLFNLKANLGCFGLFCQGVISLMRKKALEASHKLEACLEKLSEDDDSELTKPIAQVLHLYLFYTYSLLSRDNEALRQLQIQSEINLPSKYLGLIEYNRTITQGFIAYNSGQIMEAYDFFRKSTQIQASKTEPKLYLAITLFSLAKDNQKQMKELEDLLDSCCQNLHDHNGNFAAFTFYYRALFRAWKGDWNNAVNDLDAAIDKSEDNFSKFFYLRGLAWAILQNYKQGISDSSIALSIDSEDCDSYLLRARCLQIEGDPSQAFNDLQAFIALRPEDKQIHKFAGHLLFENGAFEDALQAYAQGDINSTDTEVFLTKSKTYFLLGKFSEASLSMLQASKSVSNNQLMLFDYQMMKWLAEVFFPIEKDKPKDNIKQFQESIIFQHLEKLKHMYFLQKEKKNHFGKIFKLTELSTLSGMLYFYLKKYQQASKSFLEGINLKKEHLLGELEEDFEEDEGQKKIFINQMHYNIALCFCMMRDYEKAANSLSKCQIDKELHTYQTFQELMGQVKGQIEVVEGEEYLDLFSLKNKISRFLPNTQVPFRYQHNPQQIKRNIKICIPYPKVEPPDINPIFHSSLLATADLKLMERRPEAPWIQKEHNAIKFTDKMEVYSKLSLGESSASISKRQELGVFSSNSSFNFDTDIKTKLKLDAAVESKLKRIIKK